MLQATGKRETYAFLKREEQPWKLLTCQPHLCAWKDHGTDSPSNCAEALGRWGGDLGQPVQLHQG